MEGVLAMCICLGSTSDFWISSSDGLLQVKKGPLAETSPMLNDISAVPTWSKVGYAMLVQLTLYA